MKLSKLVKKIKIGIKNTFRNNVRSDMTIHEINEMRKQNQNSVLLDVRSKQEFNEGHLNGAICIPVYELENNVNRFIVDRSTLIIAYCQSGNRSKKAVEILNKLGYSNVYEINGGLDNLF